MNKQNKCNLNRLNKKSKELKKYLKILNNSKSKYSDQVIVYARNCRKGLGQ